MKHKQFWLLFITILSLRLFFAFQSEGLTYDSYFTLKQVQNILSAAAPIFHDTLQSTPTTIPFSPFYSYLLSLFSTLLPIGIVMKLLPNILITITLIPIYYTSLLISGRSGVATTSVIFVSFMPYFMRTVYLSTPFAIFLPLFFAALYYIIALHKKQSLVHYLTSLFLLVLATPISLILVPVVWIYMLFLKVARLPNRRIELETFIFTTFFIILTYFLIYKKAVLINGLRLFHYPQTVDLLKATVGLGILPLLLSVIAIYSYTFHHKQRGMSMLISIAVVMSLLLYLRLFPSFKGVIILGISLSIIGSVFLQDAVIYLTKTRLSKQKSLLFILFAILFILTSVVPSITSVYAEKSSLAGAGQINDIKQLKNLTPLNAVVLVDIDESYMIQSLAHRAVVVTPNAVLIPNINQKKRDIVTAYTTPYQTAALTIFSRYGISYILLSKSTMNKYKITSLPYADTRCFKITPLKKSILYETLCSLKE